MSEFGGFSPRATAFYADLAADNTREFWAAHKSEYEAEVRDPMRALADALEPEFGPVSLFRPHRDIRFSPDKSPYKTYQAALAGHEAGIGYWVQIDAAGLRTGGGFHSHGPDQVDRYRTAVADGVQGPALVDIVEGLRRNGFDVEGDRLKSAPRGYSADHPRIELLRYKSLVAVTDFGTPAWLATPEAVDRVRESWRQVGPLATWVVENVGASQAPARRR